MALVHCGTCDRTSYVFTNFLRKDLWSFGQSSNHVHNHGSRTLFKFFKLNWKNKIWNLVFTVGAVIGGFISVRFLSNNQEVALNSKTVSRLESMGFEAVGQSYAPSELFSTEVATSFLGILFLLFGGVLVGFGTRYAGGCTSGHAISGISNLQTSSLMAVVGFFLGGLIMVHLIFPSLLPFWNNI